MSYASSVEEINETRRKFNISVPAPAVESALNSIAAEMQKTSELRGFRKGKAPINLVKKFYMNDIVKKAADKVIGEAYSSSLKDIDFQIVSQPHIEPINQFDGLNEFKFSATVDINPKIEITGYKELSVKLPDTFNSTLDEQYEKLIKAYQEGFSNDGPSELNDEFAKRLGYENMEIAKTKLMETLEQTQQEMKVNAAFDQIIDQILAKNSFEVAESLIESTIDRAIQEANAQANDGEKVDPANAQARAKSRDMAVRNVRGILALGHIARQEEIQVTQDEVYRELTNFAMANRIHPKDLFKNGPQIMDEFRGQVTIRKVVNKILGYGNIEYTKSEEKNSEAE